jgi:tetratricopeptide (TPR) repeat protein
MPRRRLLGLAGVASLILATSCTSSPKAKLTVNRPRADLLFVSGNFADAAEIYEQCHAAAPKDKVVLERLVSSYLNLAEETGQRKYLGKALTRTRTYIALNPKKRAGHLTFAQVYFHMGIDPLGAERLEQAVQTGGGDLVVQDLAQKMKAQGRYEFQKIKTRQEGLQNFVYYRPQSSGRASQVADRKMYGIVTSGGDFQCAYILTTTRPDVERRELLLVTPTTVDVVHVWPRVNADPDADEVDRVVSGLESVAASYRRGQEYYAAAKDADSVPQMEKAAEEFDQVLASLPSHYGALIYAAICHRALVKMTKGEVAGKHFELALALAGRLQRAEPTKPMGFRMAGLLLYEEKCFSGAADMLRATMTISPEDAEIKGAMEWLRLGVQDKPCKESSGSAGELTYVLFSFPNRPEELPPQMTTHIYEMVFSKGEVYKYTVALTPRPDLGSGTHCFMEKTEPGRSLVSLGAFDGKPPVAAEFVARVLKALEAQEKVVPPKNTAP